MSVWVYICILSNNEKYLARFSLKSFHDEMILLTVQMTNKFARETTRDWAYLYILQTTGWMTEMTGETRSQSVSKVTAKMSEMQNSFSHTEKISFCIHVKGEMKKCPRNQNTNWMLEFNNNKKRSDWIIVDVWEKRKAKVSTGKGW